MTRHYVENQTFALFRPGDDKALIVGPNGFFDIPEAYQGDPTYKLAVNAGAIKPFETAKDGEKIERAARTGQKKTPKTEKTTPKTDDANDQGTEPKKDADGK